MPITYKNWVVGINGVLHMPICKFPSNVRAHLRQCPLTPAIENIARVLEQQGLRPYSSVLILKAVCIWGGRIGPFVCSKVEKSNTPTAICAAMNKAIAHLQNNDPRNALNSVLSINGLGISFGSKLLRFLDPERCGGLDRIISQNTWNTADPKRQYNLKPSLVVHSYQMFLDDCHSISRILEKNQVTNPMGRPKDRWYMADVEMAIYAHFRNWSIAALQGACVSSGKAPAKARSANSVLQFMEWLERAAGTSRVFSNLGGRGKGFLVGKQRGLFTIIPRFTGTVLPVRDFDWISAVMERYLDCMDDVKQGQTSYYGNQWEACPDTRVCPYIAALIRHYTDQSLK
ncbi:MAG: hypothetical protein EOL87_16830 [Spartobacteria bacterium]|nr:hypothetical protein [Spartobacteria bacterium]